MSDFELLPEKSPPPHVSKPGAVDPKRPRSPVLRRPMSELEQGAIRTLANASFQSGSSDKRFVRTMVEECNAAAPGITPRQAQLLRVLVYKYRRQVGIKWHECFELEKKLEGKP